MAPPNLHVSPYTPCTERDAAAAFEGAEKLFLGGS